VYSWIDGEIYNLNEVLELFKYGSKTFSELLIDAYKNKQLETVLSKIDGCFTAILYDKNEVKLISDRYGMKPLYIWNNEDSFAWVSEVKALLALECFKPEINTKAIKCFMDLGHLLGDITWFKDVKMINAASIITYSLKQRELLEENRYWKWSDIKPQTLSLNEAAIKLSSLLQNAVQKRAKIGEKIGVSLSGGLDSRSVLAAVNRNDGQNVIYFTFGKKGCDDIKIASKVTSIKNNPHYVFELNEKNWMNERFHSVWKTDGMISLLHLHNPESYEYLRELFDININGFIGDLSMGGSWIDDLEKKINKSAASKKFGNHIEYTDLNNSFYNISHQDPYFIDTRVRRFTNVGLIRYSFNIETRRPFIDNDLIEFLYSLPDKYRYKSKLFKKTLLYYYPEYFENIPWQKTGYPISKEMTLPRRLILTIKKLLDKFPIIKTKRNFTNYSSWLRNPSIVKLTKKILDPKHAIYSNYLNINFIDKYIEPHNDLKANSINIGFNFLRFLIYSIKEYVRKRFHTSNTPFMTILNNIALKYSHDYAEEICRALTMEIWFQQVFNKKYRN
jgi:asparagine synthetase B (glutamine-hydrolysing)